MCTGAGFRGIADTVLEEAGVAYLSIAEADWDNAPDLPDDFRRAVRQAFSGRIIYAGRYTAERGARLLDAKLADLIAFGRPFIANPDLPERLARGWPLATVDPATLYGGAERGFTDYPAHAGALSTTTQDELCCATSSTKRSP